jgi:hypothetical protein
VTLESLGTVSPSRPVVPAFNDGSQVTLVNSLGTMATHRPIVRASGMEQWWNDNWLGKTEVLQENPVPVPFCPLHILHGFP